MMPPHFTGRIPQGPLKENLFQVEGYTLTISDWEVFDETRGQACQVEVEIDTQQQIAERWRGKANPPPGSVQYHSVVKVRFTPAIPGNRYRLDGPADSITLEYQGPAIEG